MKRTERRSQLIEIMHDLHQKAQIQADFTAAKITESAGISAVWFYKLVRPEFQALRSQLPGPRLSRDEELSQSRREVAELSQKLEEAQHKLRTTAVEDLDEAILLLERYEKEIIQLRQQVALLKKRLDEGGGQIIVQPAPHGPARPNLTVVNNDSNKR
jgi:septal ring factor EnvC (AmiA/AmiB activator)